MTENWKFALVLLFAILLCDRWAAGEDGCTVVMLVTEGGEETAGSAVLAVRGQLSDLPVNFLVEPVGPIGKDISSQAEAAAKTAGSRKAAAVFWADLSNSGKVFVFIPDEEEGMILVRSLGSEGKNTMSGEEAMAVIVRSVVLALPPCNPEVESAKPVKTPAKRKDPGPLMDFSLAYGLSLYAGQKPVVHGARIGISFRLLSFLRIFVGYRIVPPLRVRSDPALLSVRFHPAEVGLMLRLSRKHWKLEGGVAVVLDWLTWSVIPMRDGVSPTPPFSRPVVAFTPFVSMGWMPARFLAFFISVSLDIMANEKRYVVRNPSGPITVLDPWKVRPLFLVGTCFSFF